MATRYLSDCTCPAGDEQRLAWAAVHLAGDRHGNSPEYRQAWANWWQTAEARKVNCTCPEPF